MEVLTIEHSAFQQLISKIDAMDEFIRKAKLEQQGSLDDDWVDGQAVCEFLCICDKTLQRLRSAGKITYSTIGNKYYYQIAEIKRCLRVKRNRPDIPVSLVDRDFVLDFAAYLKVDYHLQANSAEKLMRILQAHYNDLF
ncbi:MAG: phage integrase SAM-like domain-containing protein [Alistipes sp.]|nr:phage integrase SAM-like domain-containing protein [Alistipes sp.]